LIQVRGDLPLVAGRGRRIIADFLDTRAISLPVTHVGDLAVGARVVIVAGGVGRLGLIGACKGGSGRGTDADLEVALTRRLIAGVREARIRFALALGTLAAIGTRLGLLRVVAIPILALAVGEVGGTHVSVAGRLGGRGAFLEGAFALAIPVAHVVLGAGVSVVASRPCQQRGIRAGSTGASTVLEEAFSRRSVAGYPGTGVTRTDLPVRSAAVGAGGDGGEVTALTTGALAIPIDEERAVLALVRGRLIADLG
jgi:hypothetical protein